MTLSLPGEWLSIFEAYLLPSGQIDRICFLPLFRIIPLSRGNLKHRDHPFTKCEKASDEVR